MTRTPSAPSGRGTHRGNERSWAGTAGEDRDWQLGGATYGRSVNTRLRGECAAVVRRGAVQVSTWLLVGLGWTAGCGKQETKVPPAAATNAPTATAAAAPASGGAGNPLTAPVDYLGAVGAAQKRAASVADLAPLQQAIKAFEAGEDRRPSGLMELVKEGYLPRLPQAPKGMVFMYNRQTGEVRLVPEAPAQR